MNRIRPLLLVACLAAIPLLAVAQNANAQGANAQGANAQGANWTVDLSRSRLGFSGTQTGTRFEGAFKRYDAQIQFDPAHPQSGHARIVIDVASASTGDTQRDEAMPGADWFDVKDYPKAVFEAKSFQSKGGDSYAAPGTLTIRGISRDAVLPFTLTVDGNTAHARGRLQLVRAQFGVGQGPWASGQWVALEVGVDVDLVATRSTS
jgi:polyisoprenoid-binding protein YceI